MSEDIIETLRSIQCSDMVCGNLRISMGVKLAIYEIEQLRKQRDEARQELCKLTANWTNWKQKEIKESRGWDCFKEDGK